MMEFLDQAGLKVPLPQDALPREKTEQELWNPPPYEREEPIYKIAYKILYPGEDERGDDGRKIQREDEYDEEGNIIPREGGSLHAVRLLTWVPGVPMSSLKLTLEQKEKLKHENEFEDMDGKVKQARRKRPGFTIHGLPEQPDNLLLWKTGQYLGKMTSILEEFDHEGAHRKHSWDLNNTPNIRAFMHCIEEDHHHDLVESVVQAFEKIDGFQDKVPWSVLQADFNDANIILDDGLSDKFREDLG